MEIEYRELSELIDYEKNARSHSEEQIAQIVQSITNFGYNTPIEIGTDNVIISGHARVEATRRVGLPRIPCIVQKHLEGDLRTGYILAANKIAMNASWHVPLLKEELLTLRDNGFDVLLTGFNETELDDLLTEDVLNDGLTDEDSCPEEIPEEPVTQKGDVWVLGRHRLMCGDSLSIDAVEKLMDGNKMDMV